MVRALRLGLWLAAPMALSIPACSLFGGALAPTQVALFLTMGFKAVAGTSAFTACLILVNAAAPKHALGSVNGVGQTLASGVRGLGKLVVRRVCGEVGRAGGVDEWMRVHPSRAAWTHGPHATCQCSYVPAAFLFKASLSCLCSSSSAPIWLSTLQAPRWAA